MPDFDLRIADSELELATLADELVHAVVTDPPAGIAFMGKDWDRDKGGRDQWVAWLTRVMRECHRVLKPGGHAVVWALPRTSHWTATAIEDAGFEVRDVVVHLFGTGFPKSLNVLKAIDKAAGAEREAAGTRLRSARMMCTVYAETRPATDDAKQWEGWGTALKPASEHWVLARKPLNGGTVASNVLEHGTGALNVDGCRVPMSREDAEFIEKTARPNTRGQKHVSAVMNRPEAPTVRVHEKGRWPANVALSGDAPAMLDEQSDAVSRFFYCPKASRRERSEGNDHPTVKPVELMRWLVRLVTPPGGTVLDPFMGSGTTGVACALEGFDFVGIEQDERYVDVALRRIEAAEGEAGSAQD